jgi:hypothetical protein
MTSSFPPLVAGFVTQHPTDCIGTGSGSMKVGSGMQHNEIVQNPHRTNSIKRALIKVKDKVASAGKSLPLAYTTPILLQLFKVTKKDCFIDRRKWKSLTEN